MSLLDLKIAERFEIFRGVFLYGFKTPKIVSKLPKNDLLKQKFPFFVTKTLKKRVLKPRFFAVLKRPKIAVSKWQVCHSFKTPSMSWF